MVPDTFSWVIRILYRLTCSPSRGFPFFAIGSHASSLPSVGKSVQRCQTLPIIQPSRRKSMPS